MDRYRNIVRRQHEDFNTPVDSGTAEEPSNQVLSEDAVQERRDAADLARFGKTQRFNRNFSWLSVVGLSTTVTDTFQSSFAYGVFYAILYNGTPVFFWGTLVAFLGTLCQGFIMAELASTIPLSGGQYNWVALLAPKSNYKFLSYVTGFMTIVYWQAVAMNTLYAAASGVAALASVDYPDFQINKWQMMLLMFATMAVALVTNIYLRKLLPNLEALILIFYVYGFFTVIILLVYLSPVKREASIIFSDFYHGLYSPYKTWQFGLAFGAPTSNFIGLEAAAHLSEEILNARTVVPWSMIASTVLNGVFALAMALAAVFCIVPNKATIAAINNGADPISAVFRNILGTNNGAIGVLLIPVLMSFFSSASCVATVSRMWWAFARENALPFSSTLSKVRTKQAVPVAAIIATAAVYAIFAILWNATNKAFYAFAGLALPCFNTAFIIVTCVSLWHKYSGAATKTGIKPGPFRLGVFTIPIAIAAIIYTLMGMVLVFFPSEYYVDADTWNWSFVAYFIIWIIILMDWFLRARHVYKGPLVERGLVSAREAWRS